MITATLTQEMLKISPDQLLPERKLFFVSESMKKKRTESFQELVAPSSLAVLKSKVLKSE